MGLLSAPQAVAEKGPRRAAAAPRWYAHPYNRPRYYRLALAAAPSLPRPVRSRLAAGLARLVAPRFAAERAAVRRNLARAHPERDADWLDSAVRCVFRNFAVFFADLLSLNRAPAPRLWRYVSGVEEQIPTREALDAGRGCVSITAHLGNWELAGRLLAPLGHRAHVVMAPEADSDVAALLEGRPDGPLRFRRCESPLISLELLAALRRGEIVAFQVDRALGGRGDCRIPFFGELAPFPIGPFVLAAAAGAPVVPAFCLLDGRGDYRLCVEPAFWVKRGEEVGGLARAVAILERYVHAHWDQWFNFFDVWDSGEPSGPSRPSRPNRPNRPNSHG